MRKLLWSYQSPELVVLELEECREYSSLFNLPQALQTQSKCSPGTQAHQAVDTESVDFAVEWGPDVGYLGQLIN